MFFGQIQPTLRNRADSRLFSDQPPEEFWQLLSFYMAAIAVNALPWSIPYGQGEIGFANKQIADIFAWYDGFNRIVPSWYLPDFYIST